MNTAKLKTYAPKARRDFIAAVTRRAAKFGLSDQGASPVREEGQVVIIEGQPYPKRLAAQRAKLAQRIARQGFAPVLEAAAYTWFNRFAAIRYLELHGYLDHSFRVLSHPGGGALPEILEHAQHLDLPGLDRARVMDLKLDGTRDEELYRDLLLAQCRALHQAMPFLFESVDDETELLLPEHLLQTDSLIRELVTAIPEDDWQAIEIIGWLYQFYISEKKDQVIGKVVKSEDIPAATQLFTPNWIVKYMVQNALGAQWLATYPDSPLKGQMAYYIEPAEQTDAVKAQLAAITPDSLNPEELTLIDPACGSGHILVEAYELFKAIYLERGYRQRDVARLILEKNLFGLDIDGRAAQLTGFALMMKGRADDRRLLERGVALNVMALRESRGLDADELIRSLATVAGRVSPAGVTRQSNAEFGGDDLFPGTLPQMRLGESETAQTSGYAVLTRPTITALIEIFAEAKTFGSLIQIAPELAAALPELERVLSQALETGDAFARAAAEDLFPLVRQARILAMRFDAVVANPPYMGIKGMNARMKVFVNAHFPEAKNDLFACFIERGYTLAKASSRNAMVTMQSWMFLSSFEAMRERMLREKTITSMAQIGYNSFPSMNSKVAQATVFSLANYRLGNFVGTFIDLNSAPQSADKNEVFLSRSPSVMVGLAADEFNRIPGSPIAYWVSDRVRAVFEEGTPLAVVATPRAGLATGDNPRFQRLWFEVSRDTIRTDIVDSVDTLDMPEKWFPCHSGGDFRKWYGNHDVVVNWQFDGQEIRSFRDSSGKLRSRPQNTQFYFKPGVTWTKLSSSIFAARYRPVGFVFDDTGRSAFPTSSHNIDRITSFLCSALANGFLRILNPTLSFTSGDLGKLPLLGDDAEGKFAALAQQLVSFGRSDWDSYERSWNFQSLLILKAFADPTPTLESSYTAWTAQNRQTIAEMKHLEEENNRLFIDAYGLQDELTPEVPIEQITLTVNPAYRYGKKLADDEWSVEHGFGEELETRFREDTMQELVSYAIGGMMGRYSLDAPGLIYAHSGNLGFDPSRYARFPADADGILPITDTDWFDEDAAHRLVEFIAVAWDQAHLEENLSFLAANLAPKNGESSRETLRRYLSDRFFKDHLQTYKNRPIYWCFSSGKQKAFQCLVYLHRYHSGTLARMRMEYVVPLQSKMAARIESLADDIQAAGSSAQAKRLQKERDKLTKQLDELRRFDEQLRHHADQRIALDLDDGVKVNYGKFGDLLAEVKTVTGQKSD
jgi:type II restriction/modification system DNA methylase subunit YeeA